MRKKKNKAFKQSFLSPQTLWVPKFTMMILLINTVIAFGYANSQSITLDQNKASLRKVLIDISTQSGYAFIYEDKDIEAVNSVSIEIKNANINRTLKTLFSNQPLYYSIQGKSIAIMRDNSSLKNQLKAEDPSWVQQSTITGRVVNKEGVLLSGVSVIIKGTDKGTSTDEEGRFSIDGVSETDVLVFSYIGFETQELPVGDQNNISVELEVSSSDLEEVVVVGYGT